ncbi:MAG: hypothetical protein LBK94_02915 [Prevotellaceae bacterium]|nr:hypothetical protein [Prevotellaceae bacterium]
MNKNKENSEKQNSQYVFKEFVVTQSIEDGQLPDIVRNYIQEQILEKQNNNIAAVVHKGINVVKNAYDRSFQNAMIDFTKTGTNFAEGAQWIQRYIAS